jgi:hypothetical protein
MKSSLAAPSEYTTVTVGYQAYSSLLPGDRSHIDISYQTFQNAAFPVPHKPNLQPNA